MNRKTLLPLLPSLALAAALTLPAQPLRAQQDGLVALPNVYRVQFENDWVRLVRVNVPGNANLPPHTHPPGYMVHLYFNDADPIVFEHDGAPYTVTRPPVKARSYRIGRATPETHAVLNASPGSSDYMRIEFKTAGNESLRRRIAAPPLGAETNSVVEVANTQFRATRVTIGAKQSVDVVAGENEPVLLLALTDGVSVDSAGRATTAGLTIGQERFVEAGKRETVRSVSDSPVQVLRIDFLSRPGGASPSAR